MISFLFLLSLFINCQLKTDFKITKLDSTIKDIIWCGKNQEYIFGLTDLNTVYLSSDRGGTWSKFSDIYHADGLSKFNKKQIGKVTKMILSPIDKSLLFFFGTKKINWILEDCSKKSIQVINKGKIQEYIFHPLEREWGLASISTDCSKRDKYCKSYKQLYVTKNLGKTWDYIASYIVQFSWGVTSTSHINNGISKERIILTHDPRGKGNQITDGWNYKIDLVDTDDFFKTHKVGSFKGNRFLLTANYLFVAQVVDQESQEVKLVVANSNEKDYVFKPVELNMKKLNEHSYTFLDSTEKSVFLHVNYNGEKSHFGHIYSSDYEGIRFSRSLKYNVRSTNGDCDFSKINGLEGIYISNSIESDIIDNEKADDDTADENEKFIKAHEKDLSHKEYKNFIRSFITFNKGGKWHRLKSPSVDSHKKPYDCGDYCFLNLHSFSSNFSPFYSVDSAVGIIIGNGNVGKYLTHDQDEVSTFLSRDGGLEWFEIKKGSHIYEIGNHGALIVLADEQSPTNKIYYSLDEGLTFKKIIFSDSKIKIKNIIIEPTSTSQHFVIHGYSQIKKGVKQGIIFSVDFSKMNIPQCKHSKSPNLPVSDYEIWTPNDGRGMNPMCLMGRKTIYVRRKRESQCFNKLTFERKKIIEQCHCSDDDYECDVGFARQIRNGPCSFSNKDLAFERNKPPKYCQGYYTISKGYRKIPGNSCVGGIKYDPIVLPCSNNSLYSSISLILFFSSFSVISLLILQLFNESLLYDVQNFFFEKSTKKPIMSNQNNNTLKKEKYLNLENEEDSLINK